MKQLRLSMVGQVAIEYLIGLALMVWIFFGGDPSLIELLTQALQNRFAAFSWEISLP